MITPALLGRLARVVLISTIAAYLLLGIRGVQDKGGLSGYIAASDFRQTITVAAVIAQGDGSLTYDLATQQRVQMQIVSPYTTLMPFIYPPLLAILFAPAYNLLGATGMTVVWLLVSLSLLILSLLLLRRALPQPPQPFFTSFPVLLILSSYPVFAIFLLGQISMVALLGLALSYYYLRRGREGLAGLALALVLLKFQLLPALLLVLLFKRRWRMLASFAAASGGFYLFAAIFIGFGWPLAYLNTLQAQNGWPNIILAKPQLMQSWYGLTFTLFANQTVAMVAFGLLVLLTVGLLLWLWQRLPWQPEGVQWSLGWAATLVAALLITPYLHPHDLVVLALPALIVGDGRVRALLETNIWRGLVAVLLGIWLVIPLGYGGLPITVPLLALTLLLLTRAVQPAAQPQPLPG